MNTYANIMRDLLSANMPLKIVAFTLTLSLFIWVRDDRQASVVAVAPVRVMIPQGMVLTGDVVDRVRITVQGRWSDIEGFDPTSIRPIQLLPRETTDLQLLPISDDMIDLPAGLRSSTIQPDVLRVTLQPEKRKLITIQPRIVGEPPPGFELGEAQVKPQSIEFRGPASSIDTLQTVGTEPIDVTSVTQTIEREVTLITEDALVTYDLNTPIRVRVPIKTLEVPRVIQGIPVVALNAAPDTELRPTTISATVHGPKSVVDNLNPDQLQVTIDLGDETKRGTFTRQPKIGNLPANVRLADYHPKDILVTIKTVPTE